MEGDRSKGGMFSPGETLSAAKLNDLANLAGYGKQWHSTGELVAQGPFGTVNMGRPDSPALYYDFLYPYKVIVQSVQNKDSSVDYKIYVAPGTCNNFMTKMGGKYLDDADPPSLTANKNGKNIVALRVKYSTPTFFPVESDIILLTDEEGLISSDTYGLLQLASFTSVTKDGVTTMGAPNQYIFSSQVAIRSKSPSVTASWGFLSR